MCLCRVIYLSIKDVKIKLFFDVVMLRHFSYITENVAHHTSNPKLIHITNFLFSLFWIFLMKNLDK